MLLTTGKKVALDLLREPVAPKAPPVSVGGGERRGMGEVVGGNEVVEKLCE